MDGRDALITELSGYCVKGRLAFLLGAGISIGRRSYIPGWDAFIGKLLGLLGREEDAVENVKYIESYRTQLLNEVLLQIIDRTLKASMGQDAAAEAVRICVDTSEFSPIHAFFAWSMQEFGNGVLTTNYDQLIDLAATYRMQNEGSSPLPHNLLVMLHGSVAEPASMRHTMDSVYAPLSGRIVERAVPLLEGHVLLVAGYRGADEFDVLPLIFEQHKPDDIIWIVHPSAKYREPDPLVKQKLDKIGARKPVFEDVDLLLEEVYHKVVSSERQRSSYLEQPWSQARGGNSPDWWEVKLTNWANKLWQECRDEMRFLWSRIAEHVRAPFVEEAYERFLSGSLDTPRRLFAEAHVAYHLRTRGKIELGKFQRVIAEIRSILATGQGSEHRRELTELLGWTLHEYGVVLQNSGRHLDSKLILEEATRQRVLLGDPQASYSVFQMFMNGWVAHDRRGLSVDDFSPLGWRAWLPSELERYEVIYREANSAEHHGITIHNKAFVHQAIALEYEAAVRTKDAESEFSIARNLYLEAYNIRRRLRDPRMMAQSQVRICECMLGLARAACSREDKDRFTALISEVEQLVGETKEIYRTVPQEDIRLRDVERIETEIARLRRECLDEKCHMEVASMQNMEDSFVLEEYKNANELTYHIDTLRNNLTNFYFILVGIVSAAFFAILREKAFEFLNIAALIAFLIGIVGVIDVLILAKLRSVQLEYFRVLNNIRDEVLGTNLATRWRRAIELSGDTLPKNDKITSGSHYWALSIVLIDTTLLEVALYVWFWFQFSFLLFVVLAALSTAMVIFLQEACYFRTSKPRKDPKRR